MTRKRKATPRGTIFPPMVMTARTREELASIVERLVEGMYREPDGTWNPDKEWDAAGILEDVAAALAAVQLVPMAYGDGSTIGKSDGDLREEAARDEAAAAAAPTAKPKRVRTPRPGCYVPRCPKCKGTEVSVWLSEPLRYPVYSIEVDIGGDVEVRSGDTSDYTGSLESDGDVPTCNMCGHTSEDPRTFIGRRMTGDEVAELPED